MSSESKWGCMLELLVQTFFKYDAENIHQSQGEEKISMCYKNVKIRKRLSKWIKKTLSENAEQKKSTKLSEDLRNKGNEEFKNTNDTASLKLYTESIIIAPFHSPELSLALGNRSAVLFRLHRFKDCISDIDFAINNSENRSTYAKLMIRKMKALCNFNQAEEALQCLDLLKQYIKSEVTFDTDVKDKLIEDYTKEFYCCSSQMKNNEEDPSKDFSLCQLVGGENESFPYASNILDLQFVDSSNHDRKVITRESIEPGDIIFLERPFSFVILPADCEYHCEFCCKPLFAPVACSKCTNCLFCNYQCMMEAYNTFHKWECKGMPVLKNLGVAHLALRTTLLASTKPNSVHYKQINDLVSHLEEVPAADLLQYALTATLIVVYLEEYSDFITEDRNSRTASGIGFVILKHMIQIICNGFAIKKPVHNDSPSAFVDLSLITYATGMYPSAAMMNHSCRPNIITSFYNNILVVRASKRIKKGEEVFNCYGPHVHKMKTPLRKEILKNQFFFDCKCEDCIVEDEYLVDKTNLFICMNCRNPFRMSKKEEIQKCGLCLQLIEKQLYENLITESKALRSAGTDLMDYENYKRALNVFKKREHLLKKFLDENNTELFLNISDLADCYCAIGNYESSWKYFICCVNMSVKHLEEYSVEFANLVLKMMDVFLAAKIEINEQIRPSIDHMLCHFDKMMKAVEMNFGSWSNQFLLLRSRRNDLMDLNISYHS